MLEHIAAHARAKSAHVWADRIDLDGLARFLREQHPEKTALNVEGATGIPFASVRKWLSGDAVPNGKAFAALICAYGPELLHAMVRGAPEWLSASVRDRELAALREAQDETRAKIAALEAR